jgi:hypothetical protein
MRAGMGEMRNSYNIVVGNPEGKKPFAKPRWRGEGRYGLDSFSGWLSCVC